MQKTIPIGSVKNSSFLRVKKYHFGHFLCPLAAWLFAIFTLFFLCLTLLYVPLLKSFDVHLAVSTCLEYVENIFSHSLKKSLARKTDTTNSGTILQNFNFAKFHKYQMAFLYIISFKNWNFVKFFSILLSLFLWWVFSKLKLFISSELWQLLRMVSDFFWGNEINYFPHILGLATCPTFWQTLLGLWNPSQSVHFPRLLHSYLGIFYLNF